MTLRPIARYLTILFAACTLSCTTELDTAKRMDGKEYTSACVEVYLADQVETRAGWEYDQYFPDGKLTSGERRLFNRILVFFDRDMLLEGFAYESHYPLWVDNTSQSGSITAFVIGLGIFMYPSVTTGAHYFYFCGNLPDHLYQELTTMIDRQGKMTKDEFEKIIIRGQSEYGKTIDLITNQDPTYSRGQMMTTLTPPSPRNLIPFDALQNTSTYPWMNGVTLHVERAYGKVSLAYVPPVDGQGESNGTLSDVRWQIVNDPVEMHTMPTMIDGEVITPHYHLTAQPGFDYASEAFTNAFHGRESIEDAKWVPATTRDVTDKESMGFGYCLENNNSIPTQGNSTMVLVEAVFTPSEWEDSPAAPQTGETFWRLREQDGQYAQGYYRALPATQAGQTAVAYPGGVTYYPLWLKTKDRYMVRRNGFYKIAVTNVLSAGAPDIDSVISPEEPLEPLTRGADRISTGIEWQQSDI